MGTFNVRSLLVRNTAGPLAVNWVVDLTRFTSHFPQITLSPANSRASITFERETADNCIMRLTVNPNNRLVGSFVYEGRIPGSTRFTLGSAIPNLVALPQIEFIRAAQTEFAGTQVSSEISRSREGPVRAADLTNHLF